MSKHLVLLGAGPAHWVVLEHLARTRPSGVSVTLVTPSTHVIYPRAVPAWMGGGAGAAPHTIDLNPLIAASGVRWVPAEVTALAAAAGQIQVRASSPANRPTTHASSPQVDEGAVSRLAFDVLSINTGGVMSKTTAQARMPGAQEHALFARPLSAFVRLWPAVLALGRDRAAQKRTFRIAVVGGGATGVELALALRQALPNSAVTLLTGSGVACARYPQSARVRIHAVLRRAGVHTLQERCTAVAAAYITLARGTELACDVTVIATGTEPPSWLQSSGLQLSDDGLIATQAQLHSADPSVFAVGSIASRVGTARAFGGAGSLLAGPALAANLVAALQGTPLVAYKPSARTPTLLSCGERFAIASWGPLAIGGSWVWHWSQRRHRAVVERFSSAPEPPLLNNPQANKVRASVEK